jgi:hypothetical protein
MTRTLELSPVEAALAARGILADEFDLSLDDLAPDPWAENYDVILSPRESQPADRGLMRAAIERIVSIRSRLAALQAEEYRALARLSELAVNGVEQLDRARAVASGADASGAGASGADANRAVEIAYRSMVAEAALAVRVSARTMAARVAEAEQIVRCFPHTLEELASSSINAGHMRVIVQHGLAIEDDGLRADYESIVLRQAVEVTPGRLRRFAELTAARAGTQTFQERHERAAAGRNIRVTRLPDGMSEVTHLLPTILAAGIWDRVTAQAKALLQAGDPRTFDQLRSDLAAELLLAGELSDANGAPHALARGITAEVAIVVPVLTLLGHSDEPPTIAGGSPIGLHEARRLAAKAPSLLRVLTHPVSQQVLGVDTYRPSEQLRRFLRVRDGRCRFPGCSRPPNRCDLDHTVAAEHGGPTSADNLAHLCRNDHTLKHQGGWSVRQTEPGVLEWTSPHGFVQVDRPEPTVRFVA